MRWLLGQVVPDGIPARRECRIYVYIHIRLLCSVTSPFSWDPYLFAQGTRLEALHWVNVLLQRSRTAVMAHHETLLPALFDALNAPSDRVVEEAVAVQALLRLLLATRVPACHGRDPGSARLYLANAPH